MAAMVLAMAFNTHRDQLMCRFIVEISESSSGPVADPHRKYLRSYSMFGGFGGSPEPGNQLSFEFYCVRSVSDVCEWPVPATACIVFHLIFFLFGVRSRLLFRPAECDDRK